MKNIIVWGVSIRNWLWLPLSKKFKEHYNTKVHFICVNIQDIEYWKRNDKSGIIDSFIATSHFFQEYDNCTGPTEDIYRQARQYEDKYGILVSDALQADRHLGRGFSSAGTGHPRSKLSQKATYIKSVNIFNKCMRFWEDQIERTNPDLIIGVTSGVVGKTFSAIARKRGIPIRALASAKHQSYFYWAIDEFYSFPALKENFDLTKNAFSDIEHKELNEIKRLPVTAMNYKKYMQYSSIWNLLERVIARSMNHLFKRHKKIISMGNYRLSEDIKYIYRMHREIRDAHKLNLISPEKLKGKSYVLYPLHVEPETALSMLSPEFNEQMALIELLAKNLPAGTLLVVKEHLASIGRRPRDFYSTLLEIPNVVMVPPHVYIFELAKDAKAVAVITSTLGVESAVYGVPVISFGMHNNFRFLPHVYTVESWKELRPLLVRLCKGDTKEDREKRRKDGMRYLAALKASSINLSWSDYNSKKREPASAKETEVLYSALMKSINLSKNRDSVDIEKYYNDKTSNKS